MRPLHRIAQSSLLLICIAVGGCTAPVKPNHPVPQPISRPVTESGKPEGAQTTDPLQLQVERVYERQQAIGRAMLKLPTLAERRARHTKLAGARAWLALAELSEQTGDWAGAVDCARAGKRELGELRGLSARLGVYDHSDMHWRAAELRAEQGHVEQAARLMLPILKLQTDSYVRYYSQEVAESSNPSLEQTSELPRFQVERTYKSQQATGWAVLKPPPTMEALRAKHEKLAAVRAWLSLAEQREQVGDWAGVMECARAGKRELGDLRALYPGFTVLDHSGLHWREVEDQAKQGQVKEAAEAMLGILKLRINGYERYYADEIAE